MLSKLMYEITVKYMPLGTSCTFKDIQELKNKLIDEVNVNETDIKISDKNINITNEEEKGTLIIETCEYDDRIIINNMHISE